MYTNRCQWSPEEFRFHGPMIGSLIDLLHRWLREFMMMKKQGKAILMHMVEFDVLSKNLVDLKLHL